MLIKPQTPPCWSLHFNSKSLVGALKSMRSGQFADSHGSRILIPRGLGEDHFPCCWHVLRTEMVQGFMPVTKWRDSLVSHAWQQFAVPIQASTMILTAWPHGPLPKACVLLLFIHLLLGFIGMVHTTSHGVSYIYIYIEIRNLTVHEYLIVSVCHNIERERESIANLGIMFQYQSIIWYHVIVQ